MLGFVIWIEHLPHQGRRGISPCQPLVQIQILVLEMLDLQVFVKFDVETCALRYFAVQRQKRTRPSHLRRMSFSETFDLSLHPSLVPGRTCMEICLRSLYIKYPRWLKQLPDTNFLNRGALLLGFTLKSTCYVSSQQFPIRCFAHVVNPHQDQSSIYRCSSLRDTLQGSEINMSSYM